MTFGVTFDIMSALNFCVTIYGNLLRRTGPGEKVAPIMKFQEYDEIQAARKKFFNTTVDSVISENMEALLELAK